MVGKKDPDNVAYTRSGGVISKDFHEEHLAPEKEWRWFLCRQSSSVHTLTAEPSNNRYMFHKGRKRLIKDKRDIEFFSNNIQFLEVDESDEIIVTEKPGKPTNRNPIPNPKVRVEVKKKGKKGSKAKTEVIE